MPTARAVGRAYAELETLAMKRLIDNGYALPLNESLALELDRARAHNTMLRPSAIEMRRASVQARGHHQARPIEARSQDMNPPAPRKEERDGGFSPVSSAIFRFPADAAR
jgi:hypothetical protein